MNYFIDTEFLEGTQIKRVPFFNIKYGKTPNTIDLISIGIISEDGREYYAISKDFNLKEAWNRYQWKTEIKVRRGIGSQYSEEIKTKEYWIRENVLKPIWEELAIQESNQENSMYDITDFPKGHVRIIADFNYKNLKRLIEKYGKTNNQITEDVKEFCKAIDFDKEDIINETYNPEFYAYYADYDWVAFCWLFGNMINLPKGFPMYCRDLKQMLDDKATSLLGIQLTKLVGSKEGITKQSIVSNNVQDYIEAIKNHPNYPKQDNEHNALDDAKWNFKLYKFLNTL